MRPVMSSRHSRAGLWICRPYGTPGYRLFHPHSTSSGQALRDYGTAEAVPFRLHLYCGSWVHLGYDLGHVRASARTFEGRPPLSLLKLPLTEYAIAAAHQRGADGAIGVPAIPCRAVHYAVPIRQTQGRLGICL